MLRTLYKSILLFTFLFLITCTGSLLAQSECEIIVETGVSSDSATCQGVVVNFTITSGGTDFDFEGGTIPDGWSTGPGFSVGEEPCAAPSLTNDPFYWASTAGGSTPFIATNDLDVSNGGRIEFDMRYSVQGGAPPCEGPERPTEGVYLQYSTDAGANWVDIEYWDPSPGTFGTWPFTGAWASLVVPIPPAAHTNSTRFRWIQQDSDGSQFDNWGLDNINVIPTLEGDWDYGDGGTQTDVTNGTYIYDTPGEYTVTVSTTLPGGSTCSETTEIVVYPNPVVGLPADTVFFCEAFGVQNVIATETSGLNPDSIGFVWDDLTNGTTAIDEDDTLQAPVALGTTEYSVTITDTTYTSGCIAKDTLSVRYFQQPVVDLGRDTSFCDSDSAQVLLGSNPGQPPTSGYVWNDLTNGVDSLSLADTLSVYQPNTTTRYELIVYGDPNQPSACVERDTVEITFHANPDLRPLPDSVQFCDNAGVQTFDAAASFHTNQIFYEWYDITNDSLVSDTATFDALGFSTTTTYTLTITDSATVNACQNFDTLTVRLLPTPAAPDNLPDTLQLCSVAAPLNATSASHTTSIDYVWNDLTNGINAISDSSVLIPDNLGSAVLYEVVLTDLSEPNGCQLRDSVLVPFFDGFPVAPLPESVSFCDSEGEQTFSIRLPQHGTSIAYVWNDLTNDADSVFVQDTLRANNFSATTVYEIIASDTTNDAGCEVRDTIEVTFNPNPTLPTLPNAPQFCDLDGAQTFSVLDPSHNSDFSYQWNDLTNGIANLSSAPELNANNFSSSTTYSVVVTDNGTVNQCRSSDTLNVTFFTSPTLPPLPAARQFCDSEGAQTFSIFHPSQTSAFTYAWNNLTNNQNAISTADTISVLNLSTTAEYEAVVTDPRSPQQCQNRDTIAVRFLPNPTLPNLADSSAFCESSGAQTFDAEHPSHTSAFAYQWNNLSSGQPGVSPFPLLAAPVQLGSTDYEIVVTDNSEPNACLSRDTIGVAYFPSPEVVLPPDQLICSNSVPYELQPVQVSGSNLSYNWDTGATTPELSVTDEGTYSLTVTISDSPLLCSATDEVELRFDDAPVVGLPADTTFCQGANFSQTLSAYDVTHGFQNIEYNWYETTVSGAPLSQDSTYNIDAPGTYIVQVVDRDNDCQTFDTVNVRAIAKPRFQLIGHNPPVCQAQDTLEIFATNVTGMPISWQSPTGGITTYSSDSLEVTVTESGVYAATITNTEGGLTCATRREINVELGDIPLNVVSDTTFCQGAGDFRLLARDLSQFGANVSYAWYDVSAPGTVLSTDPNFNVPGAGTYVIAVTDNARSCTKRDTARVTINPTPGAEISGYSGGTCAEQETLRVDATNALGYDVSWSGPGISNMSVDRLQILVTASGTYTLTITDPQTGCSGTDAVFVQLGDYPVVELNSQARICQTDTLRLDASDESHLPTYNYLWQSALTGEILSTEPVYLETEHETGTETYVVTVTPPSGCATRDTIRITFDEQATAAFAPYPETLCLGDEVRITATGGDTYQWNTAESTATITATPDRIGNFDYQVLVRKDASICPAATAIASVEVLEPPVLTVTENDLRLCQDELGTSSAYHFTHTDVRYTWTNTETGFVVGNTSDYTFAYDNIRPRPTYDPIAYTVSVRDNETGCALSDTVRVKFDRPPTARILENFPRQICQGDSIRFTATGGENYRWSTGETTRQITYQATQLGDQILTVETSLPNSCEPTYDTVFFNVKPAPAVEILGGDTLKACEGSSLTLRATGAPRYLWNNGTRADTLEVTPFGTVQVTVLGTDELGCSDADTVTVELQPTAELPAAITVCPDEDSVALNAASPVPATYLWSNGWRDSLFYATRSGTYTVQITSGECQYERSTQVTFLQPAWIELAADTLVCFAKNDLPLSDERRNTHTIRATATSQNPNETLFFELFTRRDSTEQLVDQNRVGTDGSITAEITESGTYFLRLRSNFGCRQTDSIVVRDICRPVVKVPEAFTPNPKDGVNDFFAPLTTGLRSLQLRVFDRYGTVVYERILDAAEGWNGYFVEDEGWTGRSSSGEALPAGTYLYTIGWTGRDPETGAPIKGEESGTVYLIRGAE